MEGKHYLAQLEMSPLGFVESCVSSRNWSNQSDTATKLGITNAPPEIPSVILQRENFIAIIFFFFSVVYILLVWLHWRLSKTERYDWLTALSRYNHRAVIITLKASSFRNGSQIFWCFGVGNWSIILFSRIIINVIILKIVKSKLIYQLISMTIAEVSYSKHTSQKPFCFQWTSLTRAKVIPGGVGAGAGWRPCDARRKIWIKLRKEAILTVTHT